MDIEDIETLEAQIEAEFALKALDGKSCFGSILFSRESECCAECEVCAPCGDEYAKNHIAILEAEEKSINQEVLDLELETELAQLEFHEGQKAKGLFTIKPEVELPKIEMADIPTVEEFDIAKVLEDAFSGMGMIDPAAPETSATEPLMEEKVMEEETVVVPEATAAAGGKLLAIDANWGEIVVCIVREKPPTLDGIHEIVARELTKQGVDAGDIRKNYYNYTRQLMGGLHRCMIMYWSDKTKTFTYRF